MYFYPKLNKSKNKQQKALLLASKKGYRVMNNGDVYSHLGNKLSLRNDGMGYLVFNVKYNGKVTPIRAHRLQAFQKYGYDLLEEGIEVRHLNGNPEDNSYSNIAIGTSSDNAFDNPNRLSKEIHQEIRDRYESENITQKELADEYGLKSQSAVHYIVNK